MRYFVGIDTGFSGAIVKLNEKGEIVQVWDMPVVSMAKSGLVYDLGKIKALFQELSEDALFIVEKTFPRSKYIGGTGKANWNLGASCMMIVGMLYGMGFHYELVDARTWTAQMLKGVEGKGKERSFRAVQGLFPKAEVVLPPSRKGAKPKMMDGRCDALLIAEYGRRKFSA